jgi:hypothetical protein
MPVEDDRRRIAGRALAAAALLALISAGCGGGGGETSTSSTAGNNAPSRSASAGISAGEKRAASRRLARELGVSPQRVKRLRGGQGFAATSVRPGEIVPGGPGPFFSSDTISPVVNGWQASDHHTYTGVDAGGNPAKPSVGELGIFRQDFVNATQTQRVVHVPGAGAVRITKAPLGRQVATSAQKRGNLQFVGKRGVHGTLHLRTDTVTISH